MTRARIGVHLSRFCLIIALALGASIAAVLTPVDPDIPLGSAAAELTAVAEPPAAQLPLASLANSCAIVATLAAHELAKTGAWTRILFIEFIEPGTGQLLGHALVVWQPPTATQICVYDESGTFDLDTDVREPGAIAAQLSPRMGKPIVAAKFLR